ncbi:MAG: EAL domain-containing protein [Gammaproteobacteria bacterium]|nr:EAL domain-containing protein [Gammaproteobacteria bacterium]MBV8404781.1 EAL domain-containing protein [Gammaproteobacteria bacterium]
MIRRTRRQQRFDPGPGTAPAQELHPVAAPRWVGPLFAALVVYTCTITVWMLCGFGGPTVTHYVALLSDMPAALISTTIAAVTARHSARGALRSAWIALAAAQGLYFIGTAIGVSSWLGGQDPFPGPADLFYCAFYPALALAALAFIRAYAVPVAWVQLALDAAIFVVGFGAFFWFLVIRPAAAGPGMDFLKQALSLAYLGLDCLLLLMLGVLLITSTGAARGRRVPALIMCGFAATFLADIFWSLAKVRGYYLPGEFQDVLYLVCYVPLAAAGREQMQAMSAPARASSPRADVFARSLPHAAMLASFLVLVYLARGDIAGPATIMTMIVFALMLLFMVRQSVAWRGAALVRERQAVRLVEDRYASLIANATDVIMIVAADGTLRFVSPAAERTLGVKPELVLGRSLAELWAGEDTDKLRMFLAEVAATSSGTVGPVELRLDRGMRRCVLESVGSNLTADPAVQGLALNFRDISERKALEEQLRQLAFHDPLTLLANRNLFRDRVQHALTLAQRGKSAIAVMFLDLDNFKNINDSLGHDAGDRLLQAVAQRIVKTTRSSDTVARLGGDEFAVLVEGIGSQRDAERLADALVDTVALAFTLNGVEVRTTASIGVALSSADTGADTLLSNADIAMYHAKSAGKNRHVSFQPQMQDMLQERLRLEADTGRALAQEEFFLEYQPIVDLRTGSLLGVEALVRWRHPEAGVLMPARFIHVLEECGQIGKLGRWVLTKACVDFCAWRTTVAAGDGLRLAVNISGRHLQHGGLVHDVAQALDDSGLEPHNLVIELTESTTMYNTDANLERFHQVKALGVRLAIDDFGTGYSSLSYLHRFPIDILKIDRSFVSRLTNSDNGPELARAVITLGDTLGLETIAEGIELEPQVEALISLGCVAGQGFLFAHAGSLEQLSHSSFVARRNALGSAAAGQQDLAAPGFKPPRLARRRAGAG